MKVIYSRQTSVVRDSGEEFGRLALKFAGRGNYFDIPIINLLRILENVISIALLAK